MSNRLEQLLTMLSNVLSASPQQPLVPETFVVQSQGMQKWLSLRLAERLGVWTSCRYQFPNTFVNGTFDALSGGRSTGSDFFERAAMTWAVMQHLPELVKEKEFNSIREYLGESMGSIKLWQLSSRIAYTFDQYLTYRPDLINAWDAGDDLPRRTHTLKMLNSSCMRDGRPDSGE